ncbi:MAG: hypothetical protein EBR82_83290 [Caulobacteraceae bacterium]|nr:hypothetical protein [Caulobacteraceae bacterium]
MSKWKKGERDAKIEANNLHLLIRDYYVHELLRHRIIPYSDIALLNSINWDTRRINRSEAMDTVYLIRYLMQKHVPTLTINSIAKATGNVTIPSIHYAVKQVKNWGEMKHGKLKDKAEAIKNIKMLKIFEIC